MAKPQEPELVPKSEPHRKELLTVLERIQGAGFEVRFLGRRHHTEDAELTWSVHVPDSPGSYSRRGALMTSEVLAMIGLDRFDLGMAVEEKIQKAKPSKYTQYLYAKPAPSSHSTTASTTAAERQRETGKGLTAIRKATAKNPVPHGELTHRVQGMAERMVKSKKWIAVGKGEHVGYYNAEFEIFAKEGKCSW